MKANNEVVQDNISITQEHEEYKSIKEFFTLELEEKNDEIKELQEEVEASNNILDLYKKWGDGLTQKLEQIEVLFKYGVPTGLKECGELCFELKAILEKSQ